MNGQELTQDFEDSNECAMKDKKILTWDTLEKYFLPTTRAVLDAHPELIVICDYSE